MRHFGPIPALAFFRCHYSDENDLRLYFCLHFCFRKKFFSWGVKLEVCVNIEGCVNFLKKGFTAPPNILIFGGGIIVILCQFLVVLMKQEDVFAGVCKFPIVHLFC